MVKVKEKRILLLTICIYTLFNCKLQNKEEIGFELWTDVVDLLLFDQLGICQIEILVCKNQCKIIELDLQMLSFSVKPMFNG